MSFLSRLLVVLSVNALAQAAAATPAAVVKLDPRSVTPGVPRAVQASVERDGVIVRWQAPISSGATPLMGYMVLSSVAEPVLVDAATTSLTIPARPGQVIEVASINEAASSLSVPARAAEVSTARGSHRMTGESASSSLASSRR